MTTQEFIDENKTQTFKKGDTVIMHTCGEADFYRGKEWICRTDSYRDRAGQDVVFLEGFTGCFMSKYLKHK
jgi:hypothetical protein